MSDLFKMSRADRHAIIEAAKSESMASGFSRYIHIEAGTRFSFLGMNGGADHLNHCFVDPKPETCDDSDLSDFVNWPTVCKGFPLLDGAAVLDFYIRTNRSGELVSNLGATWRAGRLVRLVGTSGREYETPEISYSAASREIAILGFHCQRDSDGEIRVGWPGNESAAYYTDSPSDALGTAEAMAAERAPEPDAEGEAIEAGEHEAGEPFDPDPDPESEPESGMGSDGESGGRSDPAGNGGALAAVPDRPAVDCLALSTRALLEAFHRAGFERSERIAAAVDESIACDSLYLNYYESSVPLYDSAGRYTGSRDTIT